MRAPFVVLLGLAEGVLLTNAMIACAYRCDPQWPGLDTGRCLANSESCPDPMDKAVTDDICWGLPFQPGPGDILFHDAIPFDDSNDCQGAYGPRSLAQHARMLAAYTILPAQATLTRGRIRMPSSGAGCSGWL